MTKHRRKVRSLARKLLYEDGLPWMEALAEAMLRSQCAARTHMQHNLTECRTEAGSEATRRGRIKHVAQNW